MRLRMNQAIAHALASEMREDPNVVVWGEDVAGAGGVFKATTGLLEEFGSTRVRDTPISEMGFLGAALGAAASGLRPVVEIMFAEFLGVALDQLVTEAAFFKYLSGGDFEAPVTVRTSVGAGGGFGAQHSQTLDHWFIGTPGLTVVMPSGPREAYELVRLAIATNGPVLILEPRTLYSQRAEVELSPPRRRLGSARIVSEGSDLVIVAAGSTVPLAVEATNALDCKVKLIDLETLWPWDRDLVLSAVDSVGRLLIVEEGSRGSGWGRAIAAEAAERTFNSLKAPIARVTTPPVPVPFSPPLEQRFLPTASEVVLYANALLDGKSPPSPWWEREGYVSEGIVDEGITHG